MQYCYSCNRNVDTTVKMIRESYRDVEGHHVNTSKVIRICNRCGKEIPDTKINDSSVRKAFTNYQKKLLNGRKRRFRRKEK